MYTYHKKNLYGHIHWFRFTTDKGPDWDEAYCTGPSDVSPIANQYHGEIPPVYQDGEEQYHPDCSLCYLNIYHTSDIHRERLSHYTAAMGAWRG